MNPESCTAARSDTCEPTACSTPTPSWAAGTNAPSDGCASTSVRQTFSVSSRFSVSWARPVIGTSPSPTAAIPTLQRIQVRIAFAPIVRPAHGSGADIAARVPRAAPRERPRDAAPGLTDWPAPSRDARDNLSSTPCESGAAGVLAGVGAGLAGQIGVLGPHQELADGGGRAGLHQGLPQPGVPHQRRDARQHAQVRARCVRR